MSASLDRWRERGRVVGLGGGSVFVVAAGARDAPAVLILHGFPGSSYDWHRVVASIEGAARVVAFDFLGYGLSAKPFDARYSLFEYADLAEEVVRALEIERCTLVAHDVGDTVCAELLMRAVEERLSFTAERAILLNGSIFIDLVQLSPGQQALLALPDEVLAEPLPLDAFRPGLLATFGAPPPDAVIDDMLALIARDDGSRLLPRQIRYIDERRTHQQRWTDGLVRFAGPLTAAWGALDPIAVPAMPARLKELRPSTDVITWPDVAHWPSIEAPDRVARVILDRL